jgi:hypothetical protein
MFKNKVTTELIEHYLDRMGWKRHQVLGGPGGRGGMVVTGWSGARLPEGKMLVINPDADRHVLSFRVMGVVTALPDATQADRMSQLLMSIAETNNKLLIGGYALDPADGEVSFSLAIPIASDNLTFEDFEVCIHMIVAAVEAHQRHFEELLTAA